MSDDDELRAQIRRELEAEIRAEAHVEKPSMKARLWGGQPTGKNLPSRKESLIMMVVTGVYLIFEVAFGARLLDVVGSTTDLHEIEQIENAGRLISGIALTLVVWTMFVLPRIRTMRPRLRWRRTKAAMMLGSSAFICCLASYTIQEGILDALSYGSSPEQRQAASTLTLISSSVQNSTAVLRGIDFEVIDRKSPESKTFMSLLPSLALSVDRLEERTQDAVEDLLEAQAQTAIGNPDKFFAEAYFTSMNELKRAYNDVYFTAAEEHAQATAHIPAEKDRLYRAYRNGLGQKVTPYNLPKSQYSRVRRKVRDMGVPVAWDWDPRDKEGFMEAAEGRMREKVTPSYDRAMRNAFGATLPDNLNHSTFFSHPAIQAKWREILGMEYEVPLRTDLTRDQVVTQIYRPWIKAIVDEKRPLYFSPVEAFDEGGAHYEDGITAIRVAYVPLIAFGFSLLGALVHSFKTMNFGVQAGIGNKTVRSYTIGRVAKAGLFAGVVLMAVQVSTIDNGVTNSELFRELEEQTVNRIGSPVAISMRTVIQLQPYSYPVAETLRNKILLGITYDFDRETEIPMFEHFDLEGL